MHTWLNDKRLTLLHRQFFVLNEKSVCYEWTSCTLKYSCMKIQTVACGFLHTKMKKSNNIKSNFSDNPVSLALSEFFHIMCGYVDYPQHWKRNLWVIHQTWRPFAYSNTSNLITNTFNELNQDKRGFFYINQKWQHIIFPIRMKTDKSMKI